MAIRLYLTPDPGFRLLTIETVPLNADGERQLTRPFVDFLRKQRPWAGPDALILEVGYPSAIVEAFRPATIIDTAEGLEEAAAIRWFPPWEWKGPVPWAEWLARFRTALTDHLRELARRHPELFS